MKRKAFLKNILKSAIALPVVNRIFPLKAEIRELDNSDGYRLKEYRSEATGDIEERMQYWEGLLNKCRKDIGHPYFDSDHKVTGRAFGISGSKYPKHHR